MSYEIRSEGGLISSGKMLGRVDDNAVYGAGGLLTRGEKIVELSGDTVHETGGLLSSGEAVAEIDGTTVRNTGGLLTQGNVIAEIDGNKIRDQGGFWNTGDVIATVEDGASKRQKGAAAAAVAVGYLDENGSARTEISSLVSRMNTSSDSASTTTTPSSAPSRESAEPTTSPVPKTRGYTLAAVGMGAWLFFVFPGVLLPVFFGSLLGDLLRLLIALIGWFGLPLGIYLDAEQTREYTDWPAYPWFYILGTLGLFLVLIAGPYYLWKRRSLTYEPEAGAGTQQATSSQAERGKSGGKNKQAPSENPDEPTRIDPNAVNADVNAQTIIQKAENDMKLLPAEAAAILPNLKHPNWKERSGTAAMLAEAAEEESAYAINEYTYNDDGYDLDEPIINGIEAMDIFYEMIIETEHVEMKADASWALYEFMRSFPLWIFDESRSEGTETPEDELRDAVEHSFEEPVVISYCIGILGLAVAARPDRATTDKSWFDQFLDQDNDTVRGGAERAKAIIKHGPEDAAGNFD